MKKHYFVFIITFLCFACVYLNPLHAQITVGGVKIKVFTKHKGQTPSEAYFMVGDALPKVICCENIPETLDRIEIYANTNITIKVREHDEIIYLNKEYSVEKKAIFKPFEGRNRQGNFTVSIMENEKIILEFEYESRNCLDF